MDKIIKAIIGELENSFCKNARLFGYHKDQLVGLVDAGYTLVFRDDDPDYPVLVKKAGYQPSYRC